MANAKTELLYHLKSLEKIRGSLIPIKCATIDAGTYHWYNEEYTKDKKSIDLKEGYTQEEYEEFLNKLDFEYDNGYGGQELYGTVWLMEEGSWYERGEYDGSEWWEYKRCPSIPNELKAN